MKAVIYARYSSDNQREESIEAVSYTHLDVYKRQSMHSRNRRCGILIGQGTPTRQAVQEIGAVVEGYYAAATAKALAEKAGGDAHHGGGLPGALSGEGPACGHT